MPRASSWRPGGAARRNLLHWLRDARPHGSGDADDPVERGSPFPGRSSSSEACDGTSSDEERDFRGRGVGQAHRACVRPRACHADDHGTAGTIAGERWVHLLRSDCAPGPREWRNACRFPEAVGWGTRESPKKPRAAGADPGESASGDGELARRAAARGPP